MSPLTSPLPLTLSDYRTFLEPRKRDSHKGSFGHVLIIGGDVGYAGAVRLAAEAALRIGAGLVSVATHPQHVTVIQATRPEIMCHGITRPTELEPLLSRATVVAIGPGLGLHSWGQDCLEFVLSVQNKPLVLDADALNLIAQKDYLPHPQRIFTPHPGEAARLLKIETTTLQHHRMDAITQLIQQYQGVFVLKGAGTLVGAPNTPLRICEAGNPGMATAGMGDVLTGIIAGLTAQGLSLHETAGLGVLIHALAGDLAAKTGERGLIASDLFAYLKPLMNSCAY